MVPDLSQEIITGSAEPNEEAVIKAKLDQHPDLLRRLQRGDRLAFAEILEVVAEKKS